MNSVQIQLSNALTYSRAAVFPVEIYIGYPELAYCAARRILNPTYTSLELMEDMIQLAYSINIIKLGGPPP